VRHSTMPPTVTHRACDPSYVWATVRAAGSYSPERGAGSAHTSTVVLLCPTWKLLLLLLLLSLLCVWRPSRVSWSLGGGVSSCLCERRAVPSMVREAEELDVDVVSPSALSQPPFFLSGKPVSVRLESPSRC
jgi:hypothetical protein